jgi:hypothetical protein
MTATPELIFNDMAYGRIKDGISSVATTIELYPGDMQLFIPQWSSNKNFYATITDSQNNIEIVKVTGISGQRLTVSRGQDGTVSLQWYDGAIINHRPNAAFLDAFIQKEAARQVAYNPNGVLTATYPHENVFQTGQKIWWKNVSGTDWQLIAGTLIPEFEWVKFQDYRGIISGANYQLIYDSDNNKYWYHGGQNDNNPLISSIDGLATEWAIISITQPAWFYALEYSPEWNLYLGYNVGSALGGRGLYSSTDMLSWTSRWTPGIYYIYKITYNSDAGIAVAVGSSGILATSSNGTSWTQRTSNTSEILRNVAYSPTLGLWCAVGDNATIRTSPDGVTAWISRVPDSDGYDASNDSFQSIAWGDGVFVIGGGSKDGTPFVQVSNDGINWQAYEIETSTTRMVRVIYTGNKFIGTGNINAIVYSKDGGETWTEEDLSSYNGGSPIFWSSNMAYSSENSTLVMETGYCLITAKIG